MRVVFFGTPELAVPTLAAVAGRHEVVGVVCQPDKPQGRSGTPAPPPVKVYAQAHGLPVHQPAKLNDGSFEAWLRELAPDIGVVAAYGRLLKQPILDAFPRGLLNVHPSLLPKYRGPSPIQSAVLAGEEVTGVSIMRITLEMDAGDVLLQEQVPIDPNESAEDLTARLAQVGATLMLQAMDLVAEGQAQFTPQDPAGVIHCRMFEKRHGAICWECPALTIHNQVRASLPWPVAYCLLDRQVIRIHKTRVAQEEGSGADPAMPGAIVAVGKEGIRVATGEGKLDILQLQSPGKKVLSAEEFLRGRKLTVGQRFTSATDAG